MSLPLFNFSDRQQSMQQTSWKSQIDPLLANPISNSSILKGINLVSGVNVINHLLGRQMQGWALLDINAPATIYRSAPMSNLTLTLTSNAAATVDIMVL